MGTGLKERGEMALSEFSLCQLRSRILFVDLPDALFDQALSHMLSILAETWEIPLVVMHGCAVDS